MSRFIKNDEEGHRVFFLPFLLNSKSGDTLHQKHRAVQALEGEPGKVARAGADTT